MTILLTGLLEIISLIFVASIIIFPLHYPTRNMLEDFTCRAESNNLPNTHLFGFASVASYKAIYNKSYLIWVTSRLFPGSGNGLSSVD